MNNQPCRRGAKAFHMKHVMPFASLLTCLLTCLLTLGACGTISAMVNPVSPAEVAALEEGVTIADNLALTYIRLPACPAAAPMCSVATTKQSIKGYARKAHDAVKALQASPAYEASAALLAAQTALAALVASIPSSSIATSPGATSPGVTSPGATHATTSPMPAGAN